jgi:hypothetical protein
LTDHRRIDAISAALLALAIPASALPAFADPYDYRDRRDTITSSAGNANASNIATHTVDPWPRHAKNPRINLDGRRAGIAITRYQLNQSIPPKGLENAPPVDTGAGGQSGTSLAK